MQLDDQIQIHQYNDPEILEFFTKFRVDYRLVGDHLFVVDTGNEELPAGPGDWLVVSVEGNVRVERGDYMRRARLASEAARRARRDRENARAAPVERAPLSGASSC